MILTGRDGKPIIFNNTHIVAVTVTEDMGCKSCIHCIGYSFFVKESFEEVYYQIYSETMPHDIQVKYGLYKNNLVTKPESNPDPEVKPFPGIPRKRPTPRP